MEKEPTENKFELLLTKAIAWVEKQSAIILKDGKSLNSTEMNLVKASGVVHPELVRILEVPALPLPDDAELQEATISNGLLGPNMVGLTLGYGIYICHGHRNNRLVSHELRHVFQYECAASISNFLTDYLKQINTFGYSKAPLEIDAQKHEQH